MLRSKSSATYGRIGLGANAVTGRTAPDPEAGVSITAFLSCRETKPPSLIQIRRFCAENLPMYMIPDRFSWQEALPKTSTDKIDYQRLKEMAHGLLVH